MSVSKEGNVTFGDFGYLQTYEPILVSAVEFCADIPESQKTAIVTTGIKEAVKAGNLTPDRVKKAMSRAEQDFLRKKTEDFVLATSMSFRKLPPFRKVTIGGQTIHLSKTLPRRFDRVSVEKRIPHFLPAPLPSDYIALRVTTSGRTREEAAERALASLALLVGIWNFLLTYGSFSRSLMCSNGTGPIADLRLGPLHTLHYPDGRIATETVWYEPTYAKPAPVKDYSDKFEKLRKNERWVLRQMSKAPEVERFRYAFMRYASAVDEPRLETAFLRFWSILEHLTDTGKNSYDTTVRRSAFIFSDYLFARQELQHLRDVRNGLVHLGESTNDPQAYVYQIKQYVDGLLLFLLSDANVGRSRSEINELLDLPPGAEDLKRRTALHQRAVKFRVPGYGKKKRQTGR